MIGQKSMAEAIIAEMDRCLIAALDESKRTGRKHRIFRIPPFTESEIIEHVRTLQALGRRGKFFQAKPFEDKPFEELL